MYIVYSKWKQKMAAASKKTYTTEEVSQKILETDDEDFSSDIDSEDS